MDKKGANVRRKTNDGTIHHPAVSATTAKSGQEPTVRRASVLASLSNMSLGMGRNELDPNTSSFGLLDSAKSSTMLFSGEYASSKSPNAVGAANDTIRNDNKNLFFANPLYRDRCALCGEKGEGLSRHYVLAHGEVFVSRLSPQTLGKYTNGAPCTISDVGNGKLEGFCMFCEETYVKDKLRWIFHITNHTGEHKYKCNICGKIMNNKCLASSCKSREINSNHMEKFDFECGTLFAYMCKLCNFLQLSTQNLQQHLKKQHDCDSVDEEENCIKFKLMQIAENSSQTEIDQFNQNAFNVRNIDRNMYLRKLDCPQSCVLCGQDMHVDHFIKSHPQHENFLSRLSPEMMEIAMTGPLLATNAAKAYEAKCLFCNTNNIERRTKLEWLLHFTSHTGEYMYNCASCRKIKRRSQTRCCGSNAKRFRSFTYDHNIPGFACKLCNYVQLSQDNVHKHIRNQHGMNETDIDDNCCSVTFIQFEQPRAELRRSQLSKENADSNMQQRANQQTSTIPPDENHESSFETPSSTAAELIRLKPWTNDLTAKTSFLLDDVSLFALYKCMASKCMFSCQSRQKMLDHLCFHDSLEVLEKDYLQCAYCNELSLSCQSLIDHIDGRHANSCFQCQYCFYRSVDAYGVVHHQGIHHSDKEQVILYCRPFLRTMLDNQTRDLMKAQGSNIKPIVCEADNVQFYDLHAFIRHLKMSHRQNLHQIKCCFCKEVVDFIHIKSHLLIHDIAEYLCLHCRFSNNDIACLAQHSIDDHPSQLMFIAVRRLRDNYSSNEHGTAYSTILLNLAQPVDTTKVRIRELELSEEYLNLNSAEIRFTNCPDEHQIRNKDSRLPISKEIRQILKEYTIRKTMLQFFALNDFQAGYLSE